MQSVGEGTARLEVEVEDMVLRARFESRLEEGTALRRIRGQGRPRAHRNSAEVCPFAVASEF